MIHISDISGVPAQIVLIPCRRLSSEEAAQAGPIVPQSCALMTESFSVETQHGTMVGRPGDYLMIGVTGAIYVVSAEAFTLCYGLISSASREIRRKQIEKELATKEAQSL